MERRHFELDRGYLNLDEHALYFTRSGNWQDALGTPELCRGFSPRRMVHALFGLGGLGHLAGTEVRRPELPEHDGWWPIFVPA